MTDDRAMGMSMADSRHEFEAWAKARSLPLDRLPNDEYAGYQVHTAWLCWQHRDAEIAALRAEIHLLRILEKSLPVCQKENDGLRAAATSLVEQNDSLRAEVERLRKRHHWMINRVLACDYGDNDATGKQVGWRIVADLRNGDAFMYGESTDAAIDAAMRQEPKA